MLNICVRTMQRSLRSLVVEGYITIERKLGSVNIYTLLKPMIDKAVEQVKTTMTIFRGNKKSKIIFIKVKEI